MDNEKEKDTSDLTGLVSSTSTADGKPSSALVSQSLRAFLIILPLITIGSFSNSPHGTVTDQLVYRSFGGTTDHSRSNTTSGNRTCSVSINKTSEDTIQEEATNFRLYMQIGSYLTSCLSIPVWGALSDHRGRHFIVFASSVGAILRVASMLILSVNPAAPTWILILGDTLHGCFGRGMSGLIMACAAIIADEIPPGKRTFMMITTDFFTLLSATASQFATGYWIKSSGFTPILILCLTGHLVLLLYGTMLMPKLNKKALAKSAYEEVIFCDKLKMYITQPYKTYFIQRKDFTRLCLLLISLFTFLEAMGDYGISYLLTIYALGPPLCWDSVILGIFNGVKVALNGIVPMLIGLIVIKREPSCWLVLLGLLGGAVSSMVFGFAVTNAMMFIGVVILAPRVLIPAVSRSFLADFTLPTEHGAVMSGYVLIGVIAELLAHTTYNRIYNATIACCSHCFFFISAGFYALAVLILGCFAEAKRRHHKLQNMVKELHETATS